MNSKKTARLSPTTKAPVGFLFREIKPSWGNLFDRLNAFDLTKPLQSATLLPGVLRDLFALKSKSANEEMFLLVKRALARAIGQLVIEHSNNDRQTLKAAGKPLAEHLDLRLNEEPIELSTQFFSFPGQAKVVGSVASLLASWFRASGLTVELADAAVLLLPTYFVSSLNEEVNENGELYQKLIEKYDLEFKNAVETDAAWLRYHIQLHTVANPQVLELGISLDQVYVELRAYTVKQEGSDRDDCREIRRAGMLSDMAQAWIENTDDSIFVLSGGPGAGKSAFVRRFGAWRAWSGPTPWHVLLVPLHRFKLGAELKPSLNDFASSELRHDINLFDRKCEIPLLIIFDGLDELAKQGSVGEEAAADFFRQVDDFVKDCNRDASPDCVKVMLCGRPVAVSNDRATSLL